MKPRISVVIHTLNEETNIANAIRSVASWAHECIVVDMHSEDRTVDIAQSLGAKVYFHERCGSADPARMFAESQTTGDWVFILDADEIVPVELGLELQRIADEDIADICTLSRINYFAGKPLMGSGWGPTQDLLLRFYRKGWVSIAATIHTLPSYKEGSRLYTIPYRDGYALVHFCYIGATHFLEKLNRYTTIEADQVKNHRKHVGFYAFVLRPLLEFINRYLRRGGYKDGWAGFYYSFMMLVYRMTTAAKLHEFVTVGDASAVRARYAKIAKDLNDAQTSTSAQGAE